MIVALLLALAVVIGWARLAIGHHRAPMRRGRLAVLAVLQPIAGALLYLTLVPPVVTMPTDVLTVVTAGAPRLALPRAGETRVALPEAGAGAGVETAPDLATALRRHPGARTVRVVGDGLEPRDRPAAASVSLRFDAPAMPVGLVALDPPAPTAPGAAFTVAARVAGLTDATVELVDPAGRVVDGRAPSGDGDVLLSGTARAPGTVAFGLRVRRGDRIVAQAPVPVLTEPPATTRVVVVAAAPGPEVKYLRRWAVDAGLAPATTLGVGGGTVLADGAAAWTQADAAILDDRSWAAMDAGRRAALGAAVRDGLGLVVRITGPVPRGWNVLGLGVGGGADIAPVMLPPPAPSETALAARRGPGTADAPASAAGARDGVPVLTRQAVAFAGDAVPLLRDARGTVVAAWRPVGRGRVAAVALHDSFALVTSGHGDRHAELWAGIVAGVARAQGTAPATIDPLARAGGRVTICGAGDAAAVAPDGGTTRLVADPAAGGCAGYWPIQAGWHRLTGASGRPFYVYPADAIASMGRAERRAATLNLVGDRPTTGAAVPGDRGPAWPWFLAWLAVAGGLWWFERRRPVARA